MQKKPKELTEAEEKEIIAIQEKIESILIRYVDSGEWLCEEEIRHERSSDLRRNFKKYSDIQKVTEDMIISMDGFDDIEEHIDTIIEQRNEIKKIKGFLPIDQKDEEIRGEVFSELRDAVHQGYEGCLFEKVIKYVEEIDTENWGFETIPDFVKDEIESPSEYLKTVSLRNNHLKEIKDIDISIPLDISHNPVKRINVGKGDFINIIKNTNMRTLGFNKYFADITKKCEDFVDDKVSEATEIYDYEDIEQWEKSATNLPQDIIDSIFNDDRCKLVFEAGKMTDQEIKDAIIDISKENDVRIQKEKAKIVKLAIKSEHIPFVNLFLDKNPENKELKKIQDVIDENTSIRLGQFKLLL